MRLDSGESWTADLPLQLETARSNNAVVQLLEATLQASACTVAALFLRDGSGYRRIACAGAPLGELLELVPAGGSTGLPRGAFQIAPAPPAGCAVQLRLEGRDLSCFAAANSFVTAGGDTGLLVVVGDIAHPRLSAAQGYVLEAQAATAARCWSSKTSAAGRRWTATGRSDCASLNRWPYTRATPS
jgi:hypothetical protein